MLADTDRLRSLVDLRKQVAGDGIEAPVNDALRRLIAGELPLDEWVALVRATVPPPARWREQVRHGGWQRGWARVRGWFGMSDCGPGGRAWIFSSPGGDNFSMWV